MRPLRRLALLALLLVGAAMALPSSAGGATTYITTYGNSMEPSFRSGDLAVVRTAPSYDVGDAVAYRSPQLDRIVLHRIVGRDGDAFIFQGDNNTFRDPEHLDPDHIVGRLALRLPRGGTVLSWLSNPLHAVAVAVGASALPAILISQRRRHTRHAKPTRGIPMKPATTIRLRAAAARLAVFAAALLLASGFGYTRPTTDLADTAVAFTETGSFTYTARSSSPLYPTGFTTGDPVFTRLANSVTVDFTYRLDSDQPVTVQGTVAIDAVLSGSGGWNRTVQLRTPRPLTGNNTTTEGVLHLPTLHTLAREAEAITGTAEGELRIAIAPVIDLDATVAGEPIEPLLEPTLAFTLDPTALRLEAPTGEDADQIQQSRDGTVASTASQATLLPLPPPSPDITLSTARTAALIAGATLLALAAAVAYSARRRSGDEHGAIAARHRHLIVPIRDAGNRQHHAAVDIETITDLVRVAKHHDQMILHHTTDGRHAYLVEVQGTVYRHLPTPDDDTGDDPPTASNAEAKPSPSSLPCSEPAPPRPHSQARPRHC